MGSTFLWVAPPMIGALLIYWLTIQINTDNGLIGWYHVWFIIFIFASAVWTTYAGARAAQRKLEPRRRRQLLETLNAGE